VLPGSREVNMAKIIELLEIYPESFRANLYSIEPFRMIGLIDVSIRYNDGIERVTLAFYRSSGTNSGKIKGLWYPIVGIKTHTGRFTEFTDFINFVLITTTRTEQAKRGWLAKSLFFPHRPLDSTKIRGFSDGKHYEALFEAGKILRRLYESRKYYFSKSLDTAYLNSILASKIIFKGNRHTQRENFERFIEDVFNEY
jgi:hypothetical protein